MELAGKTWGSTQHKRNTTYRLQRACFHFLSSSFNTPDFSTQPQAFFDRDDFDSINQRYPLIYFPRSPRLLSYIRVTGIHTALTPPVRLYLRTVQVASAPRIFSARLGLTLGKEENRIMMVKRFCLSCRRAWSWLHDACPASVEGSVG